MENDYLSPSRVLNTTPIISRMSDAFSDRPIWQHFSGGHWLSFGNVSSDLELEFQSNIINPSSISGNGTIDFERMISIVGNEPIRRLSPKETPDVIYEWEDSSYGHRIWTSYQTNDCEAINVSQRCGRSMITIYVGLANTPYEINFQCRTQTNKQSNKVRWIRKVPPILFAASPSAMAPDATALPQQVPSSLLGSAQHVVDGARQILTFEEGDACPICLEAFNVFVPAEQAWELRECYGHFFHAACIKIQLTRTGKCAVCSKAYIVQTGDQPRNGRMTVRTVLPGAGPGIAGYPAAGMIIVEYYFPSGVQSADHPNPGVRYSGTTRVAFLPDIPEGLEVAELLKICFQRRLTFTIGRSLTTGYDNSIVWNGVHHKTSPYGGTSHYGWPDSTYFYRVKEELKAKGITNSLL